MYEWVGDEPVALAWLRCALADFYIHDRALLQGHVGEWGVTFRLGHHLALRSDRAWDVDAEYDRQGKDGARKVRDHEARTHMRPDLVVHQRGSGGAASNLLFVEVKRIWRSPAGDRDDIDKARQAVVRHGYQLAVALGMLSAGTVFSPTWTVYAASPRSQHGACAGAELVTQAQAVFDEPALTDLEVAAGRVERMRQRGEWHPPDSFSPA